MKLLFLGDSITDCAHSFDPENLGKGYVRNVRDMLLKTRPKESISVVNKGIDGFTLQRVYDLWQNLSSKEKSSFDVVSVLAGVNDVGVWMNCGYSGQQQCTAAIAWLQCYDDLVSDILDYGIPKLVLMQPFLFPCPAKYKTWKSSIARLEEITEQIAQKYQLSCLPLQKILLSASVKPDYSDLSIDGIHLTDTGHTLVAQTWYQSVFNEIC